MLSPLPLSAEFHPACPASEDLTLYRHHPAGPSDRAVGVAGEID
jgi:hypothetical protein